MADADRTPATTRQQRPQEQTQHLFTPEMRDRQARGKDPYSRDRHSPDSDGPEDDDDESLQAEPFEDRERRGFAASVLDSPEQLAMYAQSNNDSVPGQRLRFMAQLCGYETEVESSRASSGRRDKSAAK